MSRRIYPVEKLGDINLQDYYMKANDWMDDLDYLEDELRFFKKILKLHFSDTVDATAVQIEQVERQLSKLELNKEMIRVQVINHREVLDLLIKNLITQEEEFILKEHRDLGLKIMGLNQSFKMFKTEFFQKTEDLMGNKKASKQQ
jgi:hypothetical protein